MNSADGMAADYCMRSQHDLASWPAHISASLVQDGPKRPQRKVVLGLGREAQNLAVRMVREGGVWKVDEVSDWGR